LTTKDRYLLDTNVVSEAHRKPYRQDVRFRHWLSTVERQNTFISTLVIYELRTGALLKERKDPTAGKRLNLWIDNELLVDYSSRILPITTEIADIAATLQLEKTRPAIDALIAATAIAHNLTMATRNVIDFIGIGVNVVNPWAFSG